MAIDREKLFKSLGKGASKEAPDAEPEIEGDAKPEEEGDKKGAAGLQLKAALEGDDGEAIEEAIKACYDAE